MALSEIFYFVRLTLTENPKKMASTKIINVLTLAIVVFMIVKNSNANSKYKIYI